MGTFEAKKSGKRGREGSGGGNIEEGRVRGLQ